MRLEPHHTALHHPLPPACFCSVTVSVLASVRAPDPSVDVPRAKPAESCRASALCAAKSQSGPVKCIIRRRAGPMGRLQGPSEDIDWMDVRLALLNVTHLLDANEGLASAHGAMLRTADWLRPVDLFQMGPNSAFAFSCTNIPSSE